MKIDKRFGDKVLMTPRFVFWQCQDCDKDFLEKHCFSNGKYCALDSGNSKLSGREIVLEDLRQMCVYEKAYANERTRQMFWDYIKNIHEECNNNLNEDCSRFAHKEIQLEWDSTQKCVKDSFSTSDSSKWGDEGVVNTRIDDDINYWSKYGTSLFPSIIINNSTYRGQLETQAVMNAICAGFKDAPRMCKRILQIADIEHNIGEGVIYYNDGYRVHHVLLVCAAFLVFLCIFLCCYRRYAKREMKRTMDMQIETAVNQYVKLSARDDT